MVQGCHIKTHQMDLKMKTSLGSLFCVFTDYQKHSKHLCRYGEVGEIKISTRQKYT